MRTPVFPGCGQGSRPTYCIRVLVRCARADCGVLPGDPRSAGEKEERHRRHLDDPERIGHWSLLADRLSYAPVVLVGVVDEGSHDQLLHRHRWRVREEDRTLRQLLVTEPADYGSRLGRTLAMECERLCLGAAREILRVLGVPLVEHLPREVAERLPSRKSRGDV